MNVISAVLLCAFCKASFGLTFEPFGLYEYYWSKNQTKYARSYAEANSACEELNARLAIVETEQIGEFLTDKTNATISLWTGPPYSFYIGLKRNNSGNDDKDFRWNNGVFLSSTWSNWFGSRNTRNEPNNQNNNEDCVVMGMRFEKISVGQWHDVECSIGSHYICQRNLTSTATPSVSNATIVFTKESFTTSKETQDSKNFVKNQSVGPDDVDKEDDDIYLIIYVVIPCIVVVVFIIFVAFICKRKKNKHNLRKESQTTQPPLPRVPYEYAEIPSRQIEPNALYHSMPTEGDFENAVQPYCMADLANSSDHKPYADRENAQENINVTYDSIEDFRTYDRSNSERRNYGDNREKQTNHETVKVAIHHNYSEVDIVEKNDTTTSEEDAYDRLNKDGHTASTRLHSKKEKNDFV